jgi:uncharacterized RDD family membrane protein YckC
VSAAPGAGEAAGLGRRLLSLLYEMLLLAALTLAAMLPLALLTGGWDVTLKRGFTQLYLIALTALYFIWQWTHGGQTLAMKTWRIRLVTREGAALSTGRALRRYAYALPGVALGGIGFVWALFDRERQFLHDRLAGTRIIFVPATTASPPPR